MWSKNRKGYYKKRLFYKKKKKNKETVLIIGLLFLCGIMIGLIVRDENRNNGGKYATNNKVEQSRSVSESSDLEEHVVMEETMNEEVENSLVEKRKDFIFSEEEANLIKKAINEDSEGLFKLVNKENLLNRNFYPDDLVTPNVELQQGSSSEQSKVRKQMVTDLENLFKDAESNGLYLHLNSGFRSYELQDSFYNRDIRQHGEGGSNYVAMPGASEHQLGLAVDITSTSVNMDLVEAFENTREGIWVLENAYKDGFILRYGKDKVDVTGYKYEPWHYRYIGNKEVSKICHDKNITLEELVEYQKE